MYLENTYKYTIRLHFLSPLLMVMVMVTMIMPPSVPQLLSTAPQTASKKNQHQLPKSLPFHLDPNISCLIHVNLDKNPF